MNRGFPGRTGGDDAGRTSLCSVSRSINRNVLDFARVRRPLRQAWAIPVSARSVKGASATPSAAAALPSAPSRVASSALSLFASSR